MVRDWNRFRRADHDRLRSVREETPRDPGAGRAVEAMAGLIDRLLRASVALSTREGANQKEDR